MPKFLVLPELCCVRNIEAKFKTLGLSMWSLALHGTFLDGLADIMEEIRALETIGLSFEMVWVMSLFFTKRLCGFGDQVVCFQSVFAFAAFALPAFSVFANLVLCLLKLLLCNLGLFVKQFTVAVLNAF